MKLPELSIFHFPVITARMRHRTRSGRRRTAILVASVAVALACGPTAVLGQGGPAPVVVAPVIEREVASSQSFVANVNPRRRSIIGSAVDGRVAEYLVDAGQAVEANEPLALLRTKTIEIEVAGAEAELELRRAELAELHNGSRPAEIELAEATMRAAEAANDYAKAKLARAERLFNSSSGLSQDEFEATKSEALTAIANASAASSSLELVREGPRTEQIDQAAARVAVQEQIVAGLKDRLSKYTIRSPFDGYRLVGIDRSRCMGPSRRPGCRSSSRSIPSKSRCLSPSRAFGS